MWVEPLTTKIQIQDEHNMRALVLAGDGHMVAGAPFCINAVSRCGAFGTMTILDGNGGARQTIRALVLLTRAALAFAADYGILHVETRAPDRLAAFAERMAGVSPDKSEAGVQVFRGNLASIRSHALTESDADGNLRD